MMLFKGNKNETMKRFLPRHHFSPARGIVKKHIVNMSSKSASPFPVFGAMFLVPLQISTSTICHVHVGFRH